MRGELERVVSRRKLMPNDALIPPHLITLSFSPTPCAACPTTCVLLWTILTHPSSLCIHHVQHNGLLYAVGGAELTADEPENPLQEKICAYTAPLPKPHKVDAAPALADATAPAADDD